MNTKFNLNRPPVSDDEIAKNQNFNALVEQFKQQSLKKAQGDESWRAKKWIKYSTVIAGITIVCTVTLMNLSQNNNSTKHDKITTPVTSPTSRKITPVSKKTNVPYSTYAVNAAKGATITHQKTKIQIPANCFKNSKGEIITGEVKIEYREFKNLAEVVASGMPMKYDSAGTIYSLESAGMFEIQGSQNGEPIQIASDKPIEVLLATKPHDQTFNQYYLDSVNGNWLYLNREKQPPTASIIDDSPSSTARDSQLEKDLKYMDARTSQKLDSVQKLYTTKINSLPKPVEPLAPNKATNGRPTFDIDINEKDFPEMSAFKNAVFEVLPENKNYSPALHDIEWNDIKITNGPIKGQNYWLNLSTPVKKVSLLVIPVLNGRDLAVAQTQFKEKMLEYESKMEKRLTLEKKMIEEMEAKQQAYQTELNKRKEEIRKEMLKREEAFLRASQMAQAQSANNQVVSFFAVNKFGIYNSDCARNIPSGARLAYEVKNTTPSPLAPAEILLIDMARQAVFRLPAENSVPFNPDSRYAMCAFIDGKLFVCNEIDFKNAVKQKQKAVLLPAKFDNVEDLKQAIGI